MEACGPRKSSSTRGVPNLVRGASDANVGRMRGVACHASEARLSSAMDGVDRATSPHLATASQIQD